MGHKSTTTSPVTEDPSGSFPSFPPIRKRATGPGGLGPRYCAASSTCRSPAPMTRSDQPPTERCGADGRTSCGDSHDQGREERGDGLVGATGSTRRPAVPLVARAASPCDRGREEAPAWKTSAQGRRGDGADRQSRQSLRIGMVGWTTSAASCTASRTAAPTWHVGQAGTIGGVRPVRATPWGGSRVTSNDGDSAFEDHEARPCRRPSRRLGHRWRPRLVSAFGRPCLLDVVGRREAG